MDGRGQGNLEGITIIVVPLRALQNDLLRCL